MNGTGVVQGCRSCTRCTRLQEYYRGTRVQESTGVHGNICCTGVQVYRNITGV